MSHPSLNLTARDFDAFAAEKATSNAYSRPRLEVKQRALGWARGVVARLGELGIAVDVHGSDEHPSLRNKKRVDCQWVYFWRDQAAREELARLLDRGRSIADEIDDPSPYRRHAFLALRIDDRSVEVFFAVHPEAQVDVDNLRARLVDGALAGELVGALSALPEEFSLGVTPEDRVATNSATSDTIRKMVERAAAGQVPLWIGWSIGRDTAIEHSAILDDQLEDAIIALAPIYGLVAWSRENDRIALDRRIETVEQERARAHVAAEAETERWRTEQAEARRRSLEQARPRVEDIRRPTPVPRPGHASRKPSLETLFSGPPRAEAPRRESGPRSEPGAAVRAPHPRAEVSESQAREGARSPRPPPDRAVAVKPPVLQDKRPEASDDKVPQSVPLPPATFEKGAKVCVLSGPFAGKVGVLGELDGRGSARVLLGLLSTRLELGALEVVVEGRDRPALQTSHRKALPLSPRKAR